jgi:hypothetical protein
MKVNIVMLTKNRPRLTDQTLSTLYRNTPHHLFNLTIVDDESDVPIKFHETNAVLLRIEHSSGITAQARNLGVYFAEKYWGRGDMLYLSDNDVFNTDCWLQKMLQAFDYGEPHGLKLLGGWNHPYHQTNESAKLPSGSLVCTNHALAGASQLMRWDTWDKYGPLEHGAPGVCQGEDVTFCNKITADGGKVAKLYPHVLLNTGVTNSHGQPAPGADLMVKELEIARKSYPELVWE